MKSSHTQIILTGLLLIIFSGLFCSCETSERWKSRQRMNRAMQLLESNPDSALWMLHSVQAEMLNQRDQACHLLLTLRAKEKTGQDISSDTTAFHARDYLVKIKDEKAAFALFVSASVYDAQKNTIKALPEYLRALELTKDTKDYALAGTLCYNVARLYHAQQLYSESLEYIRESLHYDRLAGVQDEYTTYSRILMVLNFTHLSQIDSALIYLDQVSDVVSPEDQSYSGMVQFSAFTLYKARKYDQALEKCREALAILQPSDSLGLGKVYLILARVYYYHGRNDSAYHYVYKSKPLLDRSGSVVDLRDLYQVLSDIERAGQHVQKALHYQDMQMAYDKVVEYSNETVLEEKRKYINNTINIIRNERDQLMLQNRLYLLGLCFTIFLFMVSVFIYWYIKRNRVRREGERQRFSSEIISIRKIANDELMKVIFHIEDIVELDRLMQEYPTDNRIKLHVKEMLGRLTWEEIYPVINLRHNGLMDRIRSDYPELDEKEYRVCCLTYAGFGALSISIVIGEQECTSQNRQTAIRKKLGVKSRGSIIRFLDQKYGITRL